MPTQAGPPSLDSFGYNAYVSDWRGVPTGGTGGGGVPAAAGSIGVPNNFQSVLATINRINREGTTAADYARIPNALDLESKSSVGIGKELTGELPPDVEAYIRNQIAANVGSSGLGGSPMDTASLLKALGKTSYDIYGEGQKHLTEALGRHPVAPIGNPENLVLTPNQAGNLALSAEQLKLEQERLNLEKWRAQQENYYKNMAATKEYGPKEYSYSLAGLNGAAGWGFPSPTPNYIYRYWM